ncbi:hypothetical protein J5I95_03940 [Candidatus Poribacteria bacterium]|nr:hypothetical protein [Candidatus Poribacteria bacterium]
MEESRNNQQSASEEFILPHQQFDIVAKDPFYVFPEDMLRFLMDRLDFEFIEHVDSNLTTVEVRHIDVLIKVLLEEQTVLVHCEIQTDDSQYPIPEDIVKESSVYQMIIERGVERGIQEGKQLGAKEFAIERILNLLNRRFNVSIAPTLTPSLEAIDNLQHLSQLMDEATEAEHLENFIQTLQTFHNGT